MQVFRNTKEFHTVNDLIEESNEILVGISKIDLESLEQNWMLRFKFHSLNGESYEENEARMLSNTANCSDIFDQVEELFTDAIEEDVGILAQANERWIEEDKKKGNELEFW